LTVLWEFSKETVAEWLNDQPFRLAAALAYYTLFSLAPLLVIAVGIAGLVFSDDAARSQIFGQLRDLLGDQGAAAVQKAVAAAAIRSSGVLTTIVGVVTLLLGASAVFGELQGALNIIWNAKPSARTGFSSFAKKRLLSLAMVVIIGFLLLVSLALSALLNTLGTYFGGLLPIPAGVMEGVNFAMSFAVITVLFAAIYKILPDVEIVWSDVWIGAAATSALFTIGKSLIGVYIGRSAVGSAYGAAGSVIMLLLWIYYSSLILFFGAELTQVYAKRRGSRSGTTVAEANIARIQ
jgi:membrane protein